MRMFVRERCSFQRIGAVIIAAAIGVVSSYAQDSGSTSQSPKPTSATHKTVKETRIVLPVCNCEEFISFNEPIIIRLRWGAKTQDLAEKGADFVIYSATVDGKLLEGLGAYRKPAVFKPGSVNGDDAWWVYWDYPLGTLPPGDHTVEAVFATSDTISDGWWTFDEGYSATLHVTLHVGEPSSGKSIYLSKLKPQAATVGWGVFSVGKYKFTSPHSTNRISNGDLITFHNIEYPHGLYAHAPSRLVYNLYGDYSQLSATIGLVDWIECGDGAQFIILLDGNIIYQSPTLVASSKPIDLTVSVAGGHTLVLITDQREANYCDWTIWGDPTLR